MNHRLELSLSAIPQIVLAAVLLQRAAARNPNLFGEVSIHLVSADEVASWPEATEAEKAVKRNGLRLMKTDSRGVIPGSSHQSGLYLGLLEVIGSAYQQTTIPEAAERAWREYGSRASERPGVEDPESVFELFRAARPS